MSGSAVESGFRAGQEASFIIQSRDSNQFPVTEPLSGGDEYQVLVEIGGESVTLTMANGGLEYLGSGQYKVSYLQPTGTVAEATTVTWVVNYVSAANPTDPVVVSTLTSTVFPDTEELVMRPSNSVLYYSSTPESAVGTPASQVGTVDTVVAGGQISQSYYLFVQLRSEENLNMGTTDGATLTYKHSGFVTVSHTAVQGTGYFRLELRSDSVGDWNIFDIMVDGVVIVPPSFKWRVSSGGVDAARCTFEGSGAISAKAGVVSSFSIYANDRFNNPVPYSAFTGVPEFSAELVPDDPTQAISATVRPAAVGSNRYIAEYIAERTGMSELHVRFASGQVITPIGSVRTIQVSNGVFDVSSLTLTPSPSDFRSVFGPPVAGGEFSITIYAYDAFQNVYSAPTLNFEMTLEPKAALKSIGVLTQRFSSARGDVLNEYVLTFSAEKAGEYFGSILEKVNNILITGSTTYTAVFVGGTPTASRSVISGTGVDGGKANAGSPVSFVVSYFDRFDNPSMKWGDLSVLWDPTGDDLYVPLVSITVTPQFATQTISPPTDFFRVASTGTRFAEYT